MKVRLRVDDSQRALPSRCLECGKKLDGVARVRDQDEAEGLLPNPGTITICLYCGHLMAFDQNMQFRELNDEEMTDVAGDPRIIAMQKARGKA